jgi:hypothetical protein
MASIGTTRFLATRISFEKKITAAELAELDEEMQKVRLEGYMRLSAAGLFCTGSTCFTNYPTPMRCSCVGPSSTNCTCDTSTATVKANLLQAQQNAKRPGFMKLRYYNTQTRVAIGISLALDQLQCLRRMLTRRTCLVWCS